MAKVLRKPVFTFIFFSLLLPIFSQFYSIEKAKKQNENENAEPSSWSLIIYRPENNEPLNEVKCYLQIFDENGNDVSSSKVKACYEYVSMRRGLKSFDSTSLGKTLKHSGPKNIFYYQKAYFLQGGIAMHLNLQAGKYFFSVKTSIEDIFTEDLPVKNWTSNSFFYDTENPTNIIFVYPTANDNGFYDGGWLISDRSPNFYKFTKPKIQKKQRLKY